MNTDLPSFSKSAKDLSRNPLGIIALFIVLVYGFACLLFGFSAGDLVSVERQPIIWFVVLFPLAVLALLEIKETPTSILQFFEVLGSKSVSFI